MIGHSLRHDGISTPHQRLYIRTLMRQLDLDTRYVTAAHRRFFEAAGISPEPNSGIDPVLCNLTKSKASALISALKKEVPDEQQ